MAWYHHVFERTPCIGWMKPGRNMYEALNGSAMIAVGFIAAFISALFVVGAFVRFISRHGFAPFAWYRNPVVNGMILRAAGTVDDTQRAVLVKQVQRLIIDDYGFTKLWDAASIYGMKSCIRFKPTRGPFDLMWVNDVDASRCR